jgi:hypothetical protein
MTTNFLEVTNEELEWLSNDELHELLFQKAFVEQQEYRNWLLELKPMTILCHADEYSKREDIVYAIGELFGDSLSREQMYALLLSPTPVADIYKWLAKCEAATSDYMSDVRTYVEDVANRYIAERSICNG